MQSWSKKKSVAVAIPIIIIVFAVVWYSTSFQKQIPPPPTIYLSDKETLLPGETWDVFLENLTYYPKGNILNLSYEANASIEYTVFFELNVVSDGRCEEVELSITFEPKREFKVLFKNDSDFEIEVSVEITVIDP